MQGEWNAKEKRSFYFHFRAEAGRNIHVERRFIAFPRGGPPMRRNPSLSRPPGCFLTRRIEYFRALAPLLANTRKSERLGFQAYPCEALPRGRPKARFLTLYGTNRGCFSFGKWPWIGNSIPWIGESMGWKQKSMGWIGRNIPRCRVFNAGRRTEARVRFNAVPYSAQGLRAWPAFVRSDRKKGATFRNGAPFHGIYIEMKKLFPAVAAAARRTGLWLFYVQM